jgi:hypothetical protein
VFEDPKSRGGRAPVMGLDVREVYASENVLGRIFYIWPVFPKFPGREKEKNHMLAELAKEEGGDCCAT